MYRPLPKKAILSPIQRKPEARLSMFDVSEEMAHIRAFSQKLQKLHDDYQGKFDDTHELSKREFKQLLASFEQEARRVFSEPTSQLVDKYAGRFNSTLATLEQAISKAHQELERAKTIQKGDPGEAATVDEYSIANKLVELMPKPKDGNDGKHADPETVIEQIKKGKKLKIEHIDGLGVEIENINHRIAAHQGGWKMRGGGDTVAAGSNITITTVNGVKTISSTGGGGGGGAVSIYNDTVTGTIDGANKTFAVAHAITNPGALILANAIYQSGVDYTASGTTITMTTAPDASLSGQPFFLMHATGLTIYTDTVSGTIDGLNVTFTVSNAITSAMLLVLGNSSYQSVVDYTTSGTTITMTSPPDASLSGQPFFLVHI